MRISDWSSDVCSSDLPNLKPFLRSGEYGIELRPAGERYRSDLALIRRIYDRVAVGVLPVTADTELQIGIGHHDLSPFPGRRRSLPMIPVASGMGVLPFPGIRIAAADGGLVSDGRRLGKRGVSRF